MTTTIPKITWDSGFSKTINFGYFLDNPMSYSQPLPASQQVQFVSGEEDAWTIDTEFILEFDWRWIPTSDTTNPVATGWDEASDGIRLFMEHARDKNEIRFFKDKDDAGFVLCRLAGPMDGPPSIEPDGTRRLHMKLRNVSQSFDGF